MLTFSAYHRFAEEQCQISHNLRVNTAGRTLAVLLQADQPRLPELADVVRDGRGRNAQVAAHLAHEKPPRLPAATHDVPAAGRQPAEDPQPVRVGERPEYVRQSLSFIWLILRHMSKYSAFVVNYQCATGLYVVAALGASRRPPFPAGVRASRPCGVAF